MPTLFSLIEVHPDKLGGTPVFRGTRLPVPLLFEYLEAGYTVDQFIEEHEIDPEKVRAFVRALHGMFKEENPYDEGLVGPQHPATAPALVP